MENKICKQCAKEFKFENYKYKDTIYKSRWETIKYCSIECEKRFNYLKHKKQYKLRNTEHDEKVKYISNLLDADIVYNNGGKYFPDLRKGNVDYEFQLLTKSVLLKKVKLWTKDNKHILIVGVPEDVVKEFDEVYFLNDFLIRIK